jgi:hypothetical protein
VQQKSSGAAAGELAPALASPREKSRQGGTIEGRVEELQDLRQEVDSAVAQQQADRRDAFRTFDFFLDMRWAECCAGHQINRMG